MVRSFRILRGITQEHVMERRSFLTATGGAAFAGWTRIASARPNEDGMPDLPPGFPSSVPVDRQRFVNWSGEIAVDDLWTCRPDSAGQLVRIVNWAARNDWRIRPRGYAHNWSPLVIDPTKPDHQVVLIDMTAGFTGAEMDGDRAVRVKAGTSMESLLSFLEDRGCGVTSCPAPGDLTVGGVLAIDGHGTGIPASGEDDVDGRTWGTISNRVLELTVVCWDVGRGRYVVRTIDRTEPDAAALMVSLGRSLVIEAVLRVEPNHNLRCESWTSISGAELFGPPGSGGRLLTDFLAESGRVETIWYPFTANPWLKVWTVEPSRPFWSREVSSPFNYPFSDNLSDDAAALVDQIVGGSPSLAPAFGGVMYAATVLGLTFDFAYDIWGPSKNLLLYVRPTTLRVTANGYAILTRRANLQQVLHDFVTKYDALVQEYRDRGEYPINGPMEIRVTGLDQAGDVDVAGARTASLSAVRPEPDHPEWDVAVWLDLLTLPGTPDSGSFYAELETWLFDRYSDENASCRVEWSKGWGYTADGPWRSADVVGTRVPASLGTDFDAAVGRLRDLDPHQVFMSGFLEELMGRPSVAGSRR